MTGTLESVDGLDVTLETLDSLRFLIEKVKHWNPRINLVSKGSLPEAMERHVADSLQLFGMVNAPVEHWLDIGSGGGFPGLVVAIYAQQSGYPRRVTLVEADARKSVFLREAARELGLSVEVVTSRAEHLVEREADVVSARALAPMVKLCGLAKPFMSETSLALFLKGENYASEIAEARKKWRFDVVVRPSKTNPKGVILAVSDIQNA